MSRIAFIGLGTMGRRMAAHLLAAGHELAGFDVEPGRAEHAGLASYGSAAAACEGAEIVILSLPSPAAVEEAVLGSGGAAEGLAAGAAVVDMSTSPPALARHLAAELAGMGVAFLDAPVSGGPAGAEAATLAVMVGGPASEFERCLPVLALMGSRVEHVGGHGAGQAVKLCNNLIVASTMAAMSEACDLIAREGIDPAQAYEVFTHSTSDSAVMRRRFPLPGVRPEHPASSGYDPMFRLDLLRKDIALALGLAAEHGVELPVTGAAAEAYDRALDLGLGPLDYSAVYLSRRGPGSGPAGEPPAA